MTATATASEGAKPPPSPVGVSSKRVPASLYAMVAALVAHGVAEWAALLPHLSPGLEEVGMWVVVCGWV